MQEIAQRVHARIAQQPVKPVASAYLGDPSGPVYVALRRDGARVASAWGDGQTAAAALDNALAKAMANAREPTTVAICVSDNYEPVAFFSGALNNIHRGILGLQVAAGDDRARYSPTTLIARNWGFKRAIEQFLYTHTALDPASIRLHTFACDQVLVTLAPQLEAVRMVRGNTLVEPAAVSQAATRETGRAMTAWLRRNDSAQGQMLYKYWPSLQAASDANNMIRQWMATLALIRSGSDRGLIERNIDYNLAHYYRRDGRFGLIIEPDGDVKLGALALAALALHESGIAAFEDKEQALRRSVASLWQPDGSFRTFYKPRERNDVQNFYPGEALLYWAVVYRDTRDAGLLRKFIRSFTYYREWHLEHRNPAFIPWHTQAYYIVWQITKRPALRDFLFRMNDWLLSMQEWRAAQYPDTKGRFYDPRRPQFGPPHASATGVYLEGLIDAYALAVKVGDTARARSYRQAIVRGLRSVMQLQFRDDVDMFYITEPARVRGGIRTTVYDNEIRVDNVQHNLLAILKILARFNPSDFEMPKAP